jgi:RimJ/RimL family protein N-acetyltransferase
VAAAGRSCPHDAAVTHGDLSTNANPAVRGLGYATEATGLLVGYLFAGWDKHKITASCDARNTASAALLERLGMRREGHLRESTWAKGEWTDDLLYGLLHDDWNTRTR